MTVAAVLARGRTYNSGGIIPEVRFRGAGLTGNVADAIIGVPNLDLAIDAVSELSLELADPGFRLLSSGLFVPGTAVSWADLKLEVAVVETGGGAGEPRLRIKARSAGPQALKRETGGHVWRNLSPTTFVAGKAKAVRLKFVGQPSAVRPSIARAKPEPGEDPESTWDVIQGLAEELGYVAFEAAGTLYFGKPSWLIKQGGDPLVCRWPTPKAGAMELEPLEVPACRRSANAADTEVSVRVVRALGLRLRPGDAVKLVGVPSFSTTYLVDSVRIELDALTPVDVGLVTPVDPEPKPPSEPHDDSPSSSSSSSGPSTGSSSGAGGSVGGPPVWPTRGRISSRFGASRPGGRRHAGLDIAAPTGTRVVATEGGTVTFAGWAGGYGNLIKVSHGGGRETRYAHLSRYARKSGRVERGELIGYVGNTGVSSGPHLHFEIRRGGTAVNPEGYLP